MIPVTDRHLEAWVDPQEKGEHMSIKDMERNNSSSFTPNSLELESKMPVNRRTGTQNVVYRYHGMSDVRRQTVSTRPSHEQRVYRDTLHASVRMKVEK